MSFDSIYIYDGDAYLFIYLFICIPYPPLELGFTTLSWWGEADNQKNEGAALLVFLQQGQR